MKRFDDLTNAELAALTEQEVAYYCDLACAEAGVRLLPPEPREPDPISVEKTVTLIAFGGYHECYMTPNHAVKVEEAIASGVVFQSSGDGEFQCYHPIKREDWNYPKSGDTKVFVSPENYEQAKEKVISYNVLKKKYDGDKSDYDNALRERRDCVQRIFDRIEEACSVLSRIERTREDFERYLTLAEGNRSVAMNFLVKAKPFLLEGGDYSSLIEELCPGRGEAQP